MGSNEADPQEEGVSDSVYSAGLAERFPSFERDAKGHLRGFYLRWWLDTTRHLRARSGGIWPRFMTRRAIIG